VCLSKRHLLVIMLVFFISSIQDLANATVITFSPGMAFQNNGNTQTVTLLTSPQNLGNRYVASNDWSHTFVAQLSAEERFLKMNAFSLRFGLTLNYVNHVNQSGVVDQFELPDFDNLNYHYTISSFGMMATLKLLYSLGKKWQTYIDAGVGVASNRAFDYQETPRITGAIAMSPYGNRRINSMINSVGVGLMYALSQQFSIGLGYAFTDLGKSALATSSAQQTTQTPTLNPLYLQVLLLHLSWNI